MPMCMGIVCREKHGCLTSRGINTVAKCVSSIQEVTRELKLISYIPEVFRTP